MQPIPDWDLAGEVLGVPGVHCGLYGPPGTGKSYRANQVPEGWQVFNITVTEDTDEHELKGGPTLPMGEFKAGLGTHAWISSHDRPTRLVVNEIHKAQGGAQTFIHALAEDPNAQSTCFELNDKDHTIIRPGPHPFQLVVTMNDDPMSLDPALADRFRWFEILDVNPEAVAALPEWMREPCLETCNQRDLDRRLSLRSWFSLATLLEAKLKLPHAVQAAFGKDRAGEILDALELAGAPGSSSNSKLPVRRPKEVQNPSFDREFSCWEDLTQDDRVGAVYCANCGVDGVASAHNGPLCKPRLFFDAEEAKAFRDKYHHTSASTPDSLQRLCLTYRTAYRDKSKIDLLIEEWAP